MQIHTTSQRFAHDTQKPLPWATFQSLIGSGPGVFRCHSLALSVILYLFSTYCVPGTILGSWDSSMSQNRCIFLSSIWELMCWCLIQGGSSPEGLGSPCWRPEETCVEIPGLWPLLLHSQEGVFPRMPLLWMRPEHVLSQGFPGSTWASQSWLANPCLHM